MTSGPFRSASYRSPKGVRPPRTPGTGREKFFSFAKEHFPDEFDFLVARSVEFRYCALGHVMPSVQEVRENLEGRGLSKAQMDGKGWL